MSSYPLLKKLLFIWADHWVKERDTTFQWVGHTRTVLESKLRGIFWNSKLVNNAGLRYQNESGEELDINFHSDWQGRVCLRGSIVICCKTKVAYSDEYENVRYKWAIHISEIYKDLQRYAADNAEIMPLLDHFQSREDGDGVYFGESLVATEEVFPSHELEIIGDSDSRSSESSELPPSEDSENDDLSSQWGVDENTFLSEIKDLQVVQVRLIFLNKKDLLSFVFYWDAFAEEVEQSDTLQEKCKLQQVCLFLEAMLSFLSNIFIKRLQNVEVEESNDVSDGVEYLLDRLEKSKYLEYFPDENKKEYNTAIAFSSVENEEKDIAEDVFNQVIAYLVSDITSEREAYNYYYLSQIALKLQKIELAKEMITKSCEYFDEYNTHDADVKFFKGYVESSTDSSVVAVASISFFPKESSENKIVSSRPLSGRLPSGRPLSGRVPSERPLSGRISFSVSSK